MDRRKPAFKKGSGQDNTANILTRPDIELAVETGKDEAQANELSATEDAVDSTGITDAPQQLPPLDQAIVTSIMATSATLMMTITKPEAAVNEKPTTPSAAEDVQSGDGGKQAVLLYPSQEERIKRMFSSLLVVGGGLSFVPGLRSVLEERYFYRAIINLT